MDYRTRLEDAVTNNYILFQVYPNIDDIDQYTSIKCGFMNNCMHETFPAMWDIVNLAQTHLVDENQIKSETKGMTSTQMKGYMEQM